MKRIILCTITLLLLFAACDKGCKIKYPKDLKPIDWENYNDVHTVYWNLVHYCSETINLQRDTIMISGWKPWNLDDFSLCDYSNAYYGNGIRELIGITCYLPEFWVMLDTCDLTKKCYIKGRIYLVREEMPSGCKVFPKIEITDINDIYFK